jgi:hypothetical protein
VYFGIDGYCLAVFAAAWAWHKAAVHEMSSPGFNPVEVRHDKNGWFSSSSARGQGRARPPDVHDVLFVLPTLHHVKTPATTRTANKTPWVHYRSGWDSALGFGPSRSIRSIAFNDALARVGCPDRSIDWSAATPDTLLKAPIATVLPEGQRNFAFGLYYAWRRMAHWERRNRFAL